MHTLLQTGIYSIPEAAHLTNVSTWRIRRWLRGYEFRVRAGHHSSPPVWEGQLEPIDHAVALGFLDLIEIRCVDALIQAGVSWPTLRTAHTNAKKMAGSTHPFCTNRFATDGLTVFLRMHEKREQDIVWDMKDIQRVFKQIIEPFLKNMEFAEGEAVQWWPMGQDHQVVLNPRRSFGRPIVVDKGIPTASLAAAFKTEQDLRIVAEWFAVSLREIQDAIDFEAKLVA